jgi:hypothetical protein
MMEAPSTTIALTGRLAFISTLSKAIVHLIKEELCDPTEVFFAPGNPPLLSSDIDLSNCTFSGNSATEGGIGKDDDRVIDD